MKIEKIMEELIRVAVTLLLLLVFLYALVPPAHAETTYYILGDRSVVTTSTPDPGFGEVKIVYVDCKKLRSTQQEDVIGCIIAANYEREKQLEKVASLKKRTSERMLAKH